MKRSPVALGLVLSVGLGVAATACGSGGESAVSVVTKSAAATTATKTARFSETFVLTLNPGAAPNPASGQPVHLDGAMDFAAKRATFRSTLPGVGSLEGVLDGAVLYEKIPRLASQTGGRPWVKIDFETIGRMGGVEGLGNLIQGQSTDPTQGIHFLRGASNVTRIGSEKVRGTSTTHYRATVDMNRAAAALSADQQSAIRQIIDKFGLTSLPVDVWIDGSDRVRRLHFTFDYSKAHLPSSLPAAALPQSLDLTLELYAFGTKVDVVIPPPDQVADFSQLIQGASDSAAKAQLSRLLTTEEVSYDTSRRFTADVATLRRLAPDVSLGAGLSVPTAPNTVNVGVSADGQIVCLTEAATSGGALVLAEEKSGPHPGTYRGHSALAACTAAGVERLGQRW